MFKLAYVRQFARRFGIHAWRTPPRGADLFSDIRNDLPHVSVRTVFDVGANIGQSTSEYLVEFPNAVIHAFEPMPATFAEMSRIYGANPRVMLHQIALGCEPGEARMDPTTDSKTSLISDHGTVAVPVDTLDRLCSERINFLKIDTEGFDLEVLKGAKGLLSKSLIDVCQVEVGMSPRHHLHVRFEDMKEWMEQHGMEMFSLIGQSPNYVPGAPYVQRADAVFVSTRVIDSHAAQPTS